MLSVLSDIHSPFGVFLVGAGGGAVTEINSSRKLWFGLATLTQSTVQRSRRESTPQ